jgi:diguanylate cyclase (GGDEF)-like protein
MDQESGRLLVRSTFGAPAETAVGLEPGTGLARRALDAAAIVVELGPPPDSSRWPSGAPLPAVVPMAAVPLSRDGAVFAVLTLARPARGRPFGNDDRDAMAMYASTAALVLAPNLTRTDGAAASIYDRSTGLFSRAFFDAAMAYRQALPRVGDPAVRDIVAATLFQLDLDGDPQASGLQDLELALIALSKMLAAAGRPGDLLARYADQQIVLVTQGSSTAEAALWAEGIRATLQASPLLAPDGRTLGVTISGGCSSVRETDLDAVSLIAAADVALFVARHSGGNCVVAG